MTAPSKTAATVTAVGAHLEALNLAGVAFAARRLLGKDPSVVTGQFTMWARSGSGGLPSLTDPMWKALSPLHIGRPASSNAAVCDMVLVGREPDAAVARQAVADGAAEGKTMFGRAPLPSGAPQADELTSAVKGYWRALATVYDEVRAQITKGDQQGAIDVMRRHAPQLRVLVKDAARLAKAIAELEREPEEGDAPLGAVPVGDAQMDGVDPDSGVVPPDPHSVVLTTGEMAVADPQSQEPATASADHFGPEGEEDVEADMGAPVRTRIEPVQSGSLHLTDDDAGAFARREALAGAAAHPPQVAARKVEVLSEKPVRNHPFLPILFLVVVSGVALYVLFSILNDPNNPLLQ